MSWQHWVLVGLYGLSFVAGMRDTKNGATTILGAVVGVMLLVWGQQ
jgi:hypothetical protein